MNFEINKFWRFYFIATATCNCCWSFWSVSLCLSCFFSILTNVSLHLFNSLLIKSIRLLTFCLLSSSSCLTSTGPHNLNTWNKIYVYLQELQPKKIVTFESGPKIFNSSITCLFSVSWPSRTCLCWTNLVKSVIKMKNNKNVADNQQKKFCSHTFSIKFLNSTNQFNKKKLTFLWSLEYI